MKPFKTPYQGTNNRDSAGAERLLFFSEQPLAELYIVEWTGQIQDINKVSMVTFNYYKVAKGNTCHYLEKAELKEKQGRSESSVCNMKFFSISPTLSLLAVCPFIQ